MPKKTCAMQDCNKKLKNVDTIMGKCRCEGIFCILHRLPELHECKHEFILDENSFIAANKCVAPKIDTA